jgi:hypothetical protein
MLLWELLCVILFRCCEYFILSILLVNLAEEDCVLLSGRQPKNLHQSVQTS